MIDAPQTLSQESAVFFVHIMKTGGTTVIQSLLNTYPDGSRYPDPQEDEMLVAAKGLTANLSALPEERRSSLRWLSPHLPLSAGTKFRDAMQRPVYIALILRDGLDRALSHLRNVSRRFDHRYSYQQLLDIPVLRDFFLTNHQTRALSMGETDWPEWDECFKAFTRLQLGIEESRLSFDISPVAATDLELAIASLSQIDALGLQGEFDDWWQRCRTQFDWPAAPLPPVNVTSKLEPGTAPPVPDLVIDELRERNKLDSQLYAAARELLKT